MEIWWLIVSLLLILWLFRRPWFKGAAGEARVRRSLRRGLPPEIYYSIHDVTLQASDGTTQIDHVVVSVFGVFIIETKGISGWLFGSEADTHWTQSLFGHSYKFQNPLRQNHRHVMVFSEVVGVHESSIRSVVVFPDSCTFMTPLPENVLRGRAHIEYIKTFQAPLLREEEVRAIVATVEAVRLPPTLATRRQHRESLRSRRESLPDRRCPRCGSRMVVRTAKQGPNAGARFWGCSTYPKCRMVQNIDR